MTTSGVLHLHDPAMARIPSSLPWNRNTSCTLVAGIASHDHGRRCWPSAKRGKMEENFPGSAILRLSGSQPNGVTREYLRKHCTKLTTPSRSGKTQRPPLSQGIQMRPITRKTTENRRNWKRRVGTRGVTRTLKIFRTRGGLIFFDSDSHDNNRGICH